MSLIQVDRSTHPNAHPDVGFHTGLYLLTDIIHKERADGSRSVSLHLDDSWGTLVGVMRSQHLHQLAGIALLSPVMVSGRMSGISMDCWIEITKIHVVKAEAQENRLNLLPRRFCPPKAIAALDSLLKISAKWPAPLQDFCSRVLMDPRLSISFLRSRASKGGYHHAYPGGLLVHSVELLDLLEPMAARLFPDNPWALPVLQVSMLFHDLGKALTVGESGCTSYRHEGDEGQAIRPTARYSDGHEAVGLEILKPHLDWLALTTPSVSSLLLEVFSYAAADPKTRGFSVTLVSDLVRSLDQLSTARDRGISFLLPV